MASEEARLRRGLILLALEANHPLRLRRKSIDRQVSAFYGGNGTALDADLRWLEDSGFVGRALSAADGRTTAVFWLTPSGQSIATGEAQDAGVAVERA